MLWITKDKQLDFEELGYHLRTVKYPQIPSVRNSKVSVIGRDGQVIFKDGYDNKNPRVLLTAIDSGNIVERRANARIINQELVKEGKLVLDYENDIYYSARILSGTSVKFSASYDEVSITFDVDPIAISRIEGDIVWEDADYSWALLNIPWAGDPFEFSVTTSDTITVNNRGNEPSKPIIRLETTSSQTVTVTKGTEAFTVTGLNGIINIDTKRMIVYDDTLTNVIDKFDGDWIGLAVGDNSIDVTGTVDITYSKKDWFI
jgi:phage-related protein